MGRHAITAAAINEQMIRRLPKAEINRRGSITTGA
jgi:hypothetical protein